MWQRRLRLADWNVVLKLCRLNEMQHQCLGSTMIYKESKDAVMLLLSPQDLPLLSEHFQAEQSNYDVTIVHELLHLHFAPFQEDDETPKGIAQEVAINCISQAIVNAYLPRLDPLSTPPEVSSAGNYM